MVQGITPTITMNFANTVDFSEITNMYFTLTQGRHVIKKTGEDVVISGHSVSVYLSQVDTIKLEVGEAEIQLNWAYADGSRACSNIVTIEISKNLLREVIE